MIIIIVGQHQSKIVISTTIRILETTLDHMIQQITEVVEEKYRNIGFEQTQGCREIYWIINPQLYTVALSHCRCWPHRCLLQGTKQNNNNNMVS